MFWYCTGYRKKGVSYFWWYLGSWESGGPMDFFSSENWQSHKILVQAQLCSFCGAGEIEIDIQNW